MGLIEKVTPNPFVRGGRNHLEYLALLVRSQQADFAADPHLVVEDSDKKTSWQIFDTVLRSAPMQDIYQEAQAEVSALATEDEYQNLRYELVGAVCNWMTFAIEAGKLPPTLTAISPARTLSFYRHLFDPIIHPTRQRRLGQSTIYGISPPTFLVTKIENGWPKICYGVKAAITPKEAIIDDVAKGLGRDRGLFYGLFDQKAFLQVPSARMAQNPQIHLTDVRTPQSPFDRSDMGQFIHFLTNIYGRAGELGNIHPTLDELFRKVTWQVLAEEVLSPRLLQAIGEIQFTPVDD